MQIRKAEVMGFCDGVRRAFRIAVEAAKQYGGVQSEGPVVHNPQAVEELARRGVTISPELSLAFPVLVRAHGAPPDLLRCWRERGLGVVDATCPHVAANQRLVAAAAAEGKFVIFAGDPDHAETRSVMGAAGGKGIVASGKEELKRIELGEEELRGRVVLVAQTTFGVTAFEEMGTLAKMRWPGVCVRNTICRATSSRQEAAARLAREVGFVVVVGGRGSANTRRLAETVRAAGGEAVLVEAAGELMMEKFDGVETVGVTSGASTPDWVTEAVCARLRGEGDG